MKRKSRKKSASSQAVGCAGELIAQARLLMRGWLVGNMNSGGMINAPAIDLMAAMGQCTLRLAVKTTGPGVRGVRWNAAPEWSSLFKGSVRPDFVIFVWFHCQDSEKEDECRIFIVPADVVDRDVKEAYDHWHRHPKRDGSAHKENGHVGIGWLGKDTSANIAHGFAEKWKQYEGNWAQLKDYSHSIVPGGFDVMS